MKARLGTIAVLTGLHFVLSIILFLVTISLGMARFETAAAATTGQLILDSVAMIMLNPVFIPVAFTYPHAFPGLLGYVPMLANSLVWALLLLAAGTGLARARARLHDTGTPISMRG